MSSSRVVSVLTSFIVLFFALLSTAIIATFNICPSVFLLLLVVAAVWGISAHNPLVGSVRALRVLGGGFFVMFCIAVFVALRISFQE